MKSSNNEKSKEIQEAKYDQFAVHMDCYAYISLSTESRIATYSQYLQDVLAYP